MKNLRANPRVAVTVDLYSDAWAQIKGVMVQGRASLIEGGPRFRKIRRQLYAKYPQYPVRAPLGEADSVIIEVTPTRVFSWGVSERGRCETADRKGARWNCRRRRRHGPEGVKPRGGHGRAARGPQTVSVHYRLAHRRPEVRQLLPWTAVFPVGAPRHQGWDEGVGSMQVGAQALLTIPRSATAAGAEGDPARRHAGVQETPGSGALGRDRRHADRTRERHLAPLEASRGLPTSSSTSSPATRRVAAADALLRPPVPRSPQRARLSASSVPKDVAAYSGAGGRGHPRRARRSASRRRTCAGCRWANATLHFGLRHPDRALSCRGRRGLRQRRRRAGQVP